MAGGQTHAQEATPDGSFDGALQLGSQLELCTQDENRNANRNDAQLGQQVELGHEEKTGHIN